MGVHLPNGYHIIVPSLQVTGSSHTCQVALMGKTKPGDAAGATLLAWTTALKLAGGPLNAAQMYVGWSVASIKVSQMDLGILTVSEDFTPVVGTKAGSVGTPMNTSILTKKNTGIAGRRYRGRAMWPNMWVNEAQVSQAGIIDGAGQTAVNALMSTYNASLSAYGINEYLGHSSSEVAPTQFITPMVVVQRVGTIKRRIRGS